MRATNIFSIDILSFANELKYPTVNANYHHFVNPGNDELSVVQGTIW